MLPDTTPTIQETGELSPETFEVIPTQTYRLDFVNKRIVGKLNQAEALMQAVQKIFNTDKYAYEIYDWYYGNELLKLVGKPYDYIVTRLPRIVREALLVDDRVTEVTDFEFNRTSVDSMTVSFLIHSVYGDLTYVLEVSL